MARDHRRLAAIVLLDVVGYSRLMGLDESGTLAALKAHRRELIDPKIAEHDGRIVKGTGDGWLLEFPSVVDAVRCAVDVQRGMAERNAGIDPNRRLDFRIGINVGDIIIDGDDIFGDGVNVAARLEALADPGGICVSRVVRDQVLDKLSCTFEDLGAQQVKNIARPVDVFRVDLDSGAPQAQGTSRSSWRRLPRGRLWRQLAAGLLVIGLAGIAAGYFVFDWFALPIRLAAVERAPAAPAGTPAQGAISDKSVAVLPLVNMSGDEKDDYLGDGISEEVLSALSTLPGLKVIGRVSSFQFRGRDVNAAKVGRELNVRSLLTGTVQRVGDDLRITVELVDAATGMQLWSQRYDRKFKNLFALEDDVAGAVSTALAVKFGAAGGRSLVRVATDNPHAHDLYLRANQLSYRSDEASLNHAMTLYNQAIAADPNYAAAWAGLAKTYLLLADGYRAPNDLLAEMKGAAERAVALDPGLADGHCFLGYILLIYEHNFPAARRELERAVALNPGFADAHVNLGNYWLMGQDPASARTEYRIAERLDPLNPWYPLMRMGTETAQGDYAAALKEARRVVELDPGFFYTTDPLVYVYAAFGHWKDCIDRYTASQAGAGGEPDYNAAVCYAHSGDIERARRMLGHLESTARTRYVDHVNIAAIHAALGVKEGALAALEQAYRDRSAMLSNLWFLPEFKPLRDDPRYRALTGRVYASLKR